MDTFLLVLLIGPVLKIHTSQGAVISHETNLIWAQTSRSTIPGNARLMSIPGDPDLWMTTQKPPVNHIAAPHFTWGFRALAFHWEDQLLFWSEGTNKKIQSLVLNGSLDTTTLFAGTSSEVYGLTVDWLSRNLYFTDGLYNWIMMTSTLPGRPGYKIVVQDGLDSPHGLAVHPSLGYLFWSDWGARPKIERSSLIGEGRKIILDIGLVKPQGLTIDYSTNRLYWTDADKGTLETADLHGRGQKVLHAAEGANFFGIAIFNNFLFVTEKTYGRLEVYNHKEKVKTFSLGGEPWDILMYDNSSQPMTSSQCSDKDCEQLCIYDAVQGATCLCGEGYLPEDPEARSCKPSQKFVHPSHFYAIGDSICHYPANMADMSLENLTLSTQCFLGNKQHTPGYMTLTYDAGENMLYVFSNTSRTILRLPLELGAKANPIEGGTGEVKGMSLDWVSGNLYWTDTTQRSIMVSKKTGQYQKVVLDRLNTPVGIAAHPGRGKIFWSDHGHLPVIAASVEKANMDGSEREVIMAGLVWEPNQLFIDFKQDSLYWSDSMKAHVRKLDLESGRITVIYASTGVKFYGISVFNDYLMWTDTHNLNGVHMARMDKKEKVRGIIHPNVGHAADLITFDLRNQPDISNPCSENVTKCAQLCLLSSQKQPKCYCTLGYTLSEDGFTCYTSPISDNFLLVSDAYQKKIFQMDLSTKKIQAVDVDTENMAISIDYDPTSKMMFWSDNMAKEIKEATIEGNYEKTIMYFNSSTKCDGIAVDYINRLLFFTDTGNKLIGVTSIEFDLIIYAYVITDDLEQPRDIVVSPNEGYIYWSDWGFRNPGIFRSDMDGSNRTVIYKPKLKRAWINGLALDWKENILYWVDAAADTISAINLETNKILVLWTDDKAHFFSIDVIGQYLYVSDWMKKYILRMPKTGGTDLVPYGVRNFSRVHGIKGHSQSETLTGKSVCSSSPCEHLCLPRADGQFTCRCAEGYKSLMEGRLCKEVATTTESSVTASTAKKATKPVAPSSASSTKSSTQDSTKSSFSSTSLPSRMPQETTQPPVTAFITKLPITMATAKIRPSSSTAVNTKVPYSGSEKTETTIATESGRNTTVARSTSPGKGAAVSTVTVAIIVCCILSALIIISIIVAYRKKYFYKVSHGKLLEEQSPASYYQIAFSGQGDNVTFDSRGGIENPTYDFLNEPKEDEDGS